MKRDICLFLICLFLSIVPQVQAQDSGDIGTMECGAAQKLAQDTVQLSVEMYGPFKNHGQMVKTAVHAIKSDTKAGNITRECHSCIVRQFAQRVTIENQEPCGPVIECPCFDAYEIDLEAQELTQIPYFQKCNQTLNDVYLLGLRQRNPDVTWASYIRYYDNQYVCAWNDQMYGIGRVIEGISSEEANVCVEILLNSMMWELNCL